MSGGVQYSGESTLCEWWGSSTVGSLPYVSGGGPVPWGVYPM